MKKGSTTNLEKKLSKYSAVAGAVLATAAGADAQVVYTDVDPDVTVTGTGNNYLLDLNNDGTDDYDLAVVMQSGTYAGGLVNYTIDLVGVNPLNSNSVMGTTGSIANYAAALDLNDMIDDAGNFLTGGSVGLGLAGYGVVTGVYSTNLNIGNFANVTDKYLGLKLIAGGMTYYGWARVDVDPSGTAFTVKDYAYNSDADQGIPAGALATGIGEASLQGVNIAQVMDKVVVNIEQTAGTGQVVIMNMAGEEVKTQALSQGTHVLDTEDLAAGVYVVSAQFENGTLNQKVMVR